MPLLSSVRLPNRKIGVKAADFRSVGEKYRRDSALIPRTRVGDGTPDPQRSYQE